MNHASYYIVLLGGFVICATLGAALPWLKIPRRKLKATTLLAPMVVLLVLTVGGQVMTSRYFIAIIPFSVSFVGFGLDMFLTLKPKAQAPSPREFAYDVTAVSGTIWSLYSSLAGLNSGFMGASA